MQAYLHGTLSEADLLGQAGEGLHQVAQYQPERQNNPQFEDTIRTLRELLGKAPTQ